MKRHLLVPLVVAGVLLAALPAQAGDGRAAVTITAHIGDLLPRVSYRPPAYVVVREPVYREAQRVIYVERDHRRHDHKDHGRRQECGERVNIIKRVYYNDDHRHRGERRIGERVVVVARGWDHWSD